MKDHVKDTTGDDRYADQPAPAAGDPHHPFANAGGGSAPTDSVDAIDMTGKRLKSMCLSR